MTPSLAIPRVRPRRSAFSLPAALLSALILPLALRAQPSFTVVPNSYAGTEGGTSATYPFSQSSMRYQQVFAASQFSGTGTITQISFRADGPSYSQGTLFLPTPVANVTITLSTTTAQPGAMSKTFANNLTSTPTTVYSGTLMMSSSCTGPSGGPNAFDTRVYLTTPFTYDPSQGNLLLDVTVNPGSAPSVPTLDAETTSSGQVTSRVYGTPSSATSGTADNKGMIVQFTFGNFAIPTSSHIGWLIFTSNVTGIAGVDSSVAKHFFDNANTLIAGSPYSNPIPSGYASATPLANYNSFAQFQSDLLAGDIDASYTNQVVMYDNENWSKTPTNEQSEPANYEALFANLAHAFGYAYLTAPSPDLTGDPAPLPSPTRYDAFLSDGYPGFSAGAPSECFDIQGQKLETDPSGYETFSWFVSSCNSAGRSANSATAMFAGITTTPFGATPTASQLAGAVTSTYNPSTYITGYWFNIPDGNYSLAEAALALLQGDGY